MAMFERSVLGLDLGSHGLKAVELKVSPRSLSPGQFRIHPRVDASAPLADHLQRFVGMHHLPTGQVACALPASLLSTRRLEFPFSDRRRLAQAIPFEIEAETPFDLEDIFVDWNLVSGDRSQGVVAATLTKREHVARTLESLEGTGCDPQVIEAEGLVLANLAPVFELQGTQLLVDIGHTKTTYCVLVEGRPILARSIPAAGRAMTEALAAERGLSFEDAEQLKCEGSVLARIGETASPGVTALVDRIAREAVRTLEAAEARQGAGPVARQATLTLVGGGARLDRIDELLARRTGLEARRLRMPADAKHAALVEGIDPVLFGPALALALRLSGETVTHMNFRQGEYAYRQDFSRLFARELRPTAALAALFLVLLVVSTASTIFLEHRRASRYHEAAGLLYAQAFPETPPPDNPVGALGQALRSAQERADFLGLYNGDRSALELLAELSRAIPTDLDVRLTEVTIDRNLIRLDVEAEGFEAADRLTAVLSATEAFQRARVAGSVKTDRSGGVSFNVSIPLSAEGEEA
ncbi:MAG: pilus assembly protein PilM [Spirochaetaceae bacterium]|nr:pilus assembly protein PilM [Spirochaetaceae bacterium]